MFSWEILPLLNSGIMIPGICIYCVYILYYFNYYKIEVLMECLLSLIFFKLLISNFDLEGCRSEYYLLLWYWADYWTSLNFIALHQWNWNAHNKYNNHNKDNNFLSKIIFLFNHILMALFVLSFLTVYITRFKRAVTRV